MRFINYFTRSFPLMYVVTYVRVVLRSVESAAPSAAFVK